MTVRLYYLGTKYTQQGNTSVTKLLLQVISPQGWGRLKRGGWGGGLVNLVHLILIVRPVTLN